MLTLNHIGVITQLQKQVQDFICLRHALGTLELRIELFKADKLLLDSASFGLWLLIDCTNEEQRHVSLLRRGPVGTVHQGLTYFA